MPSEKTLNAKNLAALGSERLAALLLKVTANDAAAKRRLRLELASRGGGGDVAGEIRKRLVSIARSRAFVDWHKIKTLARDLEMQREAIAAHVTPIRPDEAFDLLWRMLELVMRDGRSLTAARRAAGRSPAAPDLACPSRRGRYHLIEGETRGGRP